MSTISYPLRRIGLFALIYGLSANAMPQSGEGLSYWGLTGYLRIPTANIASPGRFSYQFHTLSDLTNTYERTNNHVFSIGVGKYFESGGRLTDWNNNLVSISPRGVTDLSGNMKFQLPLANVNAPGIALGAIDFAGRARQLRSAFVSVSKELDTLDFTAGLATGKTDFALDGFFMGARWRVNSKFALMVDYANEGPGLGMRLNQRYRSGTLAVEASAQREESGLWDRTIGLSASLPLGQKVRNRRSRISKVAGPGDGDVDSFLRELVKDGFTGVRLATDGDIQAVAFENQVYNRNQLDAFARVLAIAYKHLDSETVLRATLRQNAVALLSLETSLDSWGLFAKGRLTTAGYRSQIRIWVPSLHEKEQESTQGLKVAGNTGRRIDLRLQPNIRSLVGTELGTFHYSLALRADLSAPMPGKTSLLVSADLPVSNTDAYDDGEAFAASRHEAGLSQIVLQKFWRPVLEAKTLLSVGYVKLFEQDFALVQAEAVVPTGNGAGQVEGKATALVATDGSRGDQKFGTIGYQHFWHNSDVSLRLATGQFYNEERGTKIELSRFYGDAKVSAFLDIAAADDMSGGMRIAIPLTPIKNRVQATGIVVRGSQQWQYSVATTIRDPQFSGRNRIRANNLFDPVLSYTLSKDYLDSDRVRVGYVRSNLDRLRPGPEN